MLSSIKLQCYQSSIVVTEAAMAEFPTDASPTGAAITVRGLAPELKARLRVRAAHNARSMEAEARAILEAALSAPEEDPTDLAAFARSLFAPLGGVALELPPREPAREPPDLGGQALTPEQAQPSEAGLASPELASAEPAGADAGTGIAKAPRRKTAAPARGGRRR